MTAPAQTVTSGSEDVPLAEVKQVGLSEIMSIIALVAALLTAFFGRDFGLVKNAQLLAELAVFVIPMGTGFARAIKHHGVAHANALVTVAQIEAATKALVAAQQQASAGGPVPQSATASAPTSPGGPSVTYGYSDGNPAVIGRHAGPDVSELDLPVERTSST